MCITKTPKFYHRYARKNSNRKPRKGYFCRNYPTKFSANFTRNRRFFPHNSRKLWYFFPRNIRRPEDSMVTYYQWVTGKDKQERKLLQECTIVIQHTKTYRTLFCSNGQKERLNECLLNTHLERFSKTLKRLSPETERSPKAFERSLVVSERFLKTFER